MVSIVMGSDSDLPVMRGAADVLRDYGISWEVRVLSAHRAPAHVAAYAEEAADRGVQVIIAGAGLAAHLAGVVAGHTSLPVIGVPLPSRSGGLGGADALYSTVQMPPGVPVAAVAVSGAKNAGHLAARILALCDHDLAVKVDAHRRQLEAEVLEKDERLREMGLDAYLEERSRD